MSTAALAADQRAPDPAHPAAPQPLAAAADRYVSLGSTPGTRRNRLSGVAGFRSRFGDLGR